MKGKLHAFVSRFGRWRKSLLPLLLLFTPPALVQAQFTYTTANGAITITAYTGPGGDVTIPDTINGLPVTSIGDEAFAGCTNLTSVAITNSVSSIGALAFEACFSLTNLVIGNSVTNFGSGAFYGCSGLTTIMLPSSVTSIANDMFAECSGLTSLTILNGVTSIGTSAFAYCTSLTLVTIPNTVTNIYQQAFYHCTTLTNVAIPNSVITIGTWAFAWCSSLTGVTIGNSVISLGDGTFLYCSGLTNVVIPSSVASIGVGAFNFCSRLKEALFQGNAPVPAGSMVLFYGDNQATAYYLPGTTGWGSTFGGCPTALWALPYPLILTTAPSFGVQTNQFGFIMSWATNLPVVVEASANLGAWLPVSSNILTSGWSYFSDPNWTNYPARFYRIRSP